MNEHMPTQGLSTPESGPASWTGSAARKDLIVAAIAASAILAVGVYTFLQKPGAASFRSYPSATGAALPSSSYASGVDAGNSKSAHKSEDPRHSGMAGTTDPSGHRSSSHYRWRNFATGEVKTTNSPARPGAAWASY